MVGDIRICRFCECFLAVVSVRHDHFEVGRVFSKIICPRGLKSRACRRDDRGFSAFATALSNVFDFNTCFSCSRFTLIEELRVHFEFCLGLSLMFEERRGWFHFGVSINARIATAAHFHIVTVELV